MYWVTFLAIFSQTHRYPVQCLRLNCGAYIAHSSREKFSDSSLPILKEFLPFTDTTRLHPATRELLSPREGGEDSTRLQFSRITCFATHPCDQIGRILAYYTIVYIVWADFFRITQIGMYVDQTLKSCVLILTKNGLGHILGCFFKNSSGVDVMITIFCDFRQFLAKKLAFFPQTNVMIKFLQKIAVV
jgi:hypothetical protein